METNLRPLTVGEILDRTAHLYRTNFTLFAGISSVYAGAVLALGLAQIGVLELAKARQAQLGWISAALIILQLVLMFVLGGLQVAANNRAVAWVHLGQPASVRRAYAGVLPKSGRYVWLMTILMFLIGWPIALIYSGFIAAIAIWVRPLSKTAVAGATGAAAGGNQQANNVLIVMLSLVFVGLLAVGLAYAVVIGLRYALAVPACVVEDLKARQAIRRSIGLSKGARGRIFLLGLLVFIIQFGIVAATQGFFVVLSVKHHGQLAAWTRVIQQLVAFATNTFIGPMYATGLMLFYYDQRVRKEGFDIEWMMQAAGMMPAAQADETPAASADAPAAPLAEAGSAHE